MNIFDSARGGLPNCQAEVLKEWAEDEMALVGV
jgi:hypothetical protein